MATERFEQKKSYIGKLKKQKGLNHIETRVLIKMMSNYNERVYETRVRKGYY